jgi:hypothetical protein
MYFALVPDPVVPGVSISYAPAAPADHLVTRVLNRIEAAMQVRVKRQAKTFRLILPND